MTHNKETDQWFNLLSGDIDSNNPAVRHLPSFLRHVFGYLPSDPRCKFCNSPFTGLGGKLVRPFGYKPSNLSTSLCMKCENMAKREGGGGEMESSMLFADIRGSTSLAEGMKPGEFSQFIQRFYTETTNVLVRSDALIDKLIGDEVAAFFVPGFAGKNRQSFLQEITASQESKY